jgi:hypothetical protein
MVAAVLVGFSHPARARAGWFEQVAQIQAEQPHWITPLVTVTPLLEEEYRFDVDLEAVPYGRSVAAYGAGKGLELVPARRVEVTADGCVFFRPCLRIAGETPGCAFNRMRPEAE